MREVRYSSLFTWPLVFVLVAGTTAVAITSINPFAWEPTFAELFNQRAIAIAAAVGFILALSALLIQHWRRPPQKPDYKILLWFPLKYGLIAIIAERIVTMAGFIRPDPRFWSQNEKIWGAYGIVFGQLIAVWWLLSPVVRRRVREARERAAKARNIRQATASYRQAYDTYLPLWNAWKQQHLEWVSRRNAFDQWQEKQRRESEQFERQAADAAKKFLLLYDEVERRARIEEEITDSEHIDALFREVLKRNGMKHPELGLLRVCADVPAAAAAVNHPSFGQVSSALPPQVSPPGIIWEKRSPPEKPVRPAPPPNLLFSQDGGEAAPPIPPERVTWS